MGEFLKFFFQSLLVIGGWYIVNKLSVTRDMDKSRRDMVAKSADSLIEAASKILTKAREYHLEDRNESKEIELKMELQDCSQRINELDIICSDKSIITRSRSCFTELRKAITLEHFEDEHTQPLTNKDLQLQKIADAVLKTNRALLQMKYIQFSKDNAG